MRVQIVTNPNAGRGRGTERVRSLTELLIRRGHRVHEQSIEQAAAPSGDRTGPGEVDAMVIAGGDGTIHAILPRAVAAGMPIYHLPMGTENLFAREFGMTAEPGCVVAAIEAGETTLVDVGEIDSTPFALMCSIGPDAGVVHRLARTRTGPIAHRSYVRPILAEIARPHLSRVSARVDGQLIIDQQRGLLVAANCRQYGFRLDPARSASMTDGQLDLVFMPCASSPGALLWAVRAKLGTHERAGRLVRAAGTRIELSWDDDHGRYQVDGEAATASAHGGLASMVVGIRPGALSVLRPAPRQPA